MFGSIGGPELLLIFVLALLLFGPRKLPEIGKTIGRTLAEFKRTTNEFSTSLEREVELEKLKEVRADLSDAGRTVSRSSETAAGAPPSLPPSPMGANRSSPEATMSFLEHLDELRSRLLRCILVYVAMFAACWYWSGQLLRFLLRPMQEHLEGGAGDIVFINVTEPFFIYMKAAALAAIFISCPFILFQLWGFVSPGLYRRERLMALPFLFFGTAFFAAGGAFGYYVAIPHAAGWLIALGQGFKAALTLRSAFQFVSFMLLGMGLIFELPVLIFFLARLGIVTPGFLMRNFRVAVILMAIVSAVITPTGDILTLSMFAGPMIGLYLLGVAIAWIFGRKQGSDPR